MFPWFFHSKRAPPIKVQPSQRSPSQSLLHYETGSPPPSARVDPKLKLQPRRPLRLWDYWKFGFIVASKATEVTTDVLSHHIWGPRRKSWGIEMTVVTSLMRGAERHSALVDIGTIRMLMGIGGLVPLPSDAIVSPVTFRVKKRKLRGILSEFDEKETGKRELSGEWVVGRKTWQRMQTEWKASKISEPTFSRTTSVDSTFSESKGTLKRKERVILYIHGGAYYLSSAAAQRIISIPLAKYTDSRVFALDYRLAPETCFPGPLHDAVSAYLRLVEDLHIPPENIIICGDSAGGGLSLALLMYLRDNGYALPSGAILMSPWVDLTMSCESWDLNAAYDVVPFPTADNHMNPIALYLGEHTERYLTHPYASPLFGDFKGLPPLLIQAGDAEVLRDEITLLAHKATSAGVQVMHELYDDAIHVFQAYPFLDAAHRSFESMRNFVRNVLPKYQSRSPQLLAAIAERGMEEEMETERTVFVSGDGVEVSDIGGDKRAPLRAGSDQNEEISSDEDGDNAPSWVRSPVWPALPSSRASDTKEKVDFEHIEDAHLESIPHLSLSHTSPLLHHAASVPPTPTSPYSKTHFLNSSTTSFSSIDDLTSSLTRSPLLTSNPRRMHHMDSLTTTTEPDFSQQAYTFKLFPSSATRQSSIQMESPMYPSNSTMSPVQPPAISSPSMKHSAGLTLPRRKSKGLLSVGGTEPRPSSGQGDLRKMVDNWTRQGSANQTVVVASSQLYR